MSGHLQHACQVTPISSKAYLAMKRPFSLRGECRVCRDVGVVWLRVAPSHLCQCLLFILFYTFFIRLKGYTYIHYLQATEAEGNLTGDGINPTSIHTLHTPLGRAVASSVLLILRRVQHLCHRRLCTLDNRLDLEYHLQFPSQQLPAGRVEDPRSTTSVRHEQVAVS